MKLTLPQGFYLIYSNAYLTENGSPFSSVFNISKSFLLRTPFVRNDSCRCSPCACHILISNHAPSWGATTMVLPSISEALFQSTLPSRGVTPAGSRKNDKQRISTHAPLLWNNWKLNFNPRSPRGERQLDRLGVPFWVQFQSTLPSRGATRPFSGCGGVGIFQSTLPSRGATGCLLISTLPEEDFNPRSPRGERLDMLTRGASRDVFQSTLPSRGATSRRKSKGI